MQALLAAWLVALLVEHAVAQALLPICAKACIVSALSSTDCHNITDTQCICASELFEVAAPCVDGACSATDQAGVDAYHEAFCANFSTSTSATTSSTASSSATSAASLPGLPKQNHRRAVIGGVIGGLVSALVLFVAGFVIVLRYRQNMWEDPSPPPRTTHPGQGHESASLDLTDPQEMLELPATPVAAPAPRETPSPPPQDLPQHVPDGLTPVQLDVVKAMTAHGSDEAEVFAAMERMMRANRHAARASVTSAPQQDDLIVGDEIV